MTTHIREEIAPGSFRETLTKTYMNGTKPGWLRREFDRARARSEQVPPHARPIIVNGSFASTRRKEPAMAEVISTFTRRAEVREDALTLVHLRELVAATEGWPPDSPVELTAPRSSEKLKTGITVNHKGNH